ncbi:MAG: hypothetical protein QOD36_1324 [Mycobacterium sp.]|jgi:hypothetical protein|nr:hypothetical protein [Mycobacterium sp.]MDT5329167.1 hypothetical protein [Mycobacterium sp.]
MSGTQSSKEDSTDVLVTVDKAYRDMLPEVSRRLQTAGLTEEALYEISGVIAGKASPEDLSKLREVEGVAAVEQEPTFRAT